MGGYFPVPEGEIELDRELIMHGWIGRALDAAPIAD
jgi:hypothetical protein